MTESFVLWLIGGLFAAIVLLIGAVLTTWKWYITEQFQAVHRRFDDIYKHIDALRSGQEPKP